jgi:hypothetical protein
MRERVSAKYIQNKAQEIAQLAPREATRQPPREIAPRRSQAVQVFDRLKQQMFGRLDAVRAHLKSGDLTMAELAATGVTESAKEIENLVKKAAE